LTNPDHGREPSRSRLDEVFGEVLPETTADERDPGVPERDRESWYRENRPPHHE
jgi:hypothetical protein